MDMNDMILVSVDDHLCEPPDMFDKHLDAKWKDEAPKVVRNEAGDDVWTFNGQVVPNVGLNAVAGRSKDSSPMEPVRFEDMRRGCFDPAARVADMDLGGVNANREKAL